MKLTKKEKKRRAKIRKESTKGWQEGQRKILHKKCWKLMSEVVRRSNADWRGNVECFTCRKLFNWKELHAGHRHHNKLDFDFDNIKPQCCSCNTYKNGNLGEYERRLIEEHGLKFAQDLKKKADRFIRYEDLEKIKLDLENKLLILNK